MTYPILERWITSYHVVERWKLDRRFTYVFIRGLNGEKDWPYLTVTDDFGSLVEVEPDFSVID